ncbi:transposase [Aliarcobacter skirrowii]|nr:transposase [Aliarcobacter skirrowii]MDX4050809.1 transposase [Aliarcobacter skirrowii]
MGRKKGQVFSAEFKTRIVLELLEGDATINQIASKHNITVKSIQNWKKQFLENAFLAFDNIAQLHKIAKILNIDICEFFKGK